MTLGAATEHLAGELGRLVGEVSPVTARSLDAIGRRVAGPFVVAVAGRFSTGKSTLVNALLGRDVAPTDAGECTRLVTRFTRDTTEHLVVVAKDESTVTTALEGGRRIPANVPAVDAGGRRLAITDIDHLEVHLVTGALDGLDIVDTPGLAGTLGHGERAMAFLDPGSLEVCAAADAVVFCITMIVREDTVEVLQRALRALGDRFGLASLVVMNRADEFPGGLPAATEHCDRLAQGLRGLTSRVVPVAALAGAATRCGLLGARRLSAASAVARLDAGTRSILCTDLGMFTQFPVEAVGVAEREDLVRTASFAGAVALVEHLAAHPGDQVGALDAVEAVSNLREFDAALGVLSGRADALKAQAGIVALERLARRADIPAADAGRCRDLVGNLRTRPVMAGIAQLAVLEEAAHDPALLSADELDELTALFTTGSPARRLRACGPGEDLASVAWAGARRWQAEVGGLAGVRRRHAASVARRAYLSLWEQLSEGAEVRGGAG